MIKALIAVRSGSQRVVNKNLRSFAGSNLLEIKINQLKRIKELDGIIVNSNDKDMLLIAHKLGCETVERDEYYASNSVIMSEVYKNMAENSNTDIILYANATNPLVKDETISTAIRMFYENENENYDSLNSGHLIKEFLFKNNMPVNYDLRKQPRSQDLPELYALNFAINILKRDTMISNMNVVGLKPYIFGIDEIEATDIDNQIDFEFAEFVYNKLKKESDSVAN